LHNTYLLFAGNVRCTVHYTTVVRYDRFFDDLNRLYNVLFVLDFNGHLIWDINPTFNDPRYHAWYGVRARNLNDLLDDLLLILRLADEDLSRYWDMDNLLDDLLHWVRDVTCHDVLYRDRYAHFMGYSDLVGLVERTIDHPHDFAVYRVRHWAFDNAVDWVRNADLFRYADFNRNVDSLLNDSGYGVRYWNVNKSVNRVWLRSLQNTGYWVWDTYCNLVWNIVRLVNRPFHNTGNGVRHWAVYNLLDFVRGRDLHDLLHWVWNWSFHYLLYRVRNRDFLSDASFDRHGNSVRAVHGHVNWYGYIHVAEVGNGVRTQYFAQHFVWVGYLNRVGYGYSSWYIDELLYQTLDWYRDSLFNEVFYWYRYSAFNVLFIRDGDLDWVRHRHVNRY